MRRHPRLRHFGLYRNLLLRRERCQMPIWQPNGLASNPSRKSKTNSVLNSASPKPAPAPTKPAESAKPATVNTPNVPVQLATSGTIRPKRVKIPSSLAPSVHCITVMALARISWKVLRLYWAWLFMKNRPTRMVG